MRFFILVYNPRFILVQNAEKLQRLLKEQTGHVIEICQHLDDRDMPMYLINSEENKHINIGDIKDGANIAPLTQIQEDKPRA